MTLLVPPLQTTLLHFWEKTSRTMAAIHESFKGCPQYEFSALTVRRAWIRSCPTALDAANKHNRRLGYSFRH